MMLHPTSYEPYSSVSFQHKQPTSPYPDDEDDRGHDNTRHRKAFLNALLDSRPAITTKPQSSRRCRWRRYRNRILLGCLLIALLLCVFSNHIAIYWAFFRVKLDNYLFDHGWVPCGVLRKSPVLYVQDTDHVQVVWEMNCGMQSKDMTVTWNKAGEQTSTTTDPVDPVFLDSRHTLYKTTLGPLEGGEYEYCIQTQQRRTQRKAVLARHRFSWHGHDAKTPIRIAAMADNQFGMRTFVSLLRRVRKKVDYLLHAGDAVQNYPSLRQWQTDFVAPLTYYGFGQTAPLIYAHGNHDHDPTFEYHYTRMDPSSDPWYAFSMADGAIRFIVLDSNLDWPQQDDWLKRELASEAFQYAQFRVVVVHVPPFLEYWDPEAWFEKHENLWGAFVRERFVPLFEKYGVDLVISGHQHNYERGQRNGIHYAIIGGAGGDLDFERVENYNMYENTLLDFHFVLLEFTPPSKQESRWQLTWEMYDLNGKLMDSMTTYSQSREPIIEEPKQAIHEGAVEGDAIEELTYSELDDNAQLEQEGPLV